MQEKARNIRAGVPGSVHEPVAETLDKIVVTHTQQQQAQQPEPGRNGHTATKSPRQQGKVQQGKQQENVVNE